jgi:hypothetical protein
MKKSIFYKYKLQILIGLIVGIFLLNSFLPDKISETKAEDLALGQDNKKSIGIVDDVIVHCTDLDNLDSCYKSYKNNNDKMPVILWLGNSQLHAINQQRPNDEVSSSLLHKKLKKFGIYTLTFSQANSNLQEHYLLFAHLLNKFPIEILILPVFFDDMREDGLRTGFKVALDNLQTLERIKKTFTGKNIISQYNDNKQKIDSDKLKIEENNLQNYLEKYLNIQLGNIWSIWNERDNLRVQFYNTLYLIRNTIFKIDSITMRKMIKGPYIKNQKAFEDILNLAYENKIKTIVYIPPLRNDANIPYDPNEYYNFKKDIENITNKYNFNFVLLENIIPNEFWGFSSSVSLKKEPELDFMHFKGEGHHLLSENLFIEIKKLKE